MSVALKAKKQRSVFQEFIQQFESPLRTFHYNPDASNQEFFIDSIEGEPGCYCMTAQGLRVRLGESIKIEQSEQYQTYLVDNIEYYSEPSDMWMAVLHRI